MKSSFYIRLNTGARSIHSKILSIKNQSVLNKIEKLKMHIGISYYEWKQNV